MRKRFCKRCGEMYRTACKQSRLCAKCDRSRGYNREKREQRAIDKQLAKKQ